MKNQDKNTDKPYTIHGVSCCCFCGAKIKNESNSLHVWELEYECGYKIYGAIDVETYGDDIMIDTKCGNCN